MRAFLALPVEGEAADALARRQGHIPGARAVDPGDFHLTMAFLGDQPEAQLFDLLPDIAEAAGARLDVTLTGPVLLGGKAARAVALDAARDPALLARQTRLEHLLRASGLDLERRRFRPHVTLFRLPRRPDPDMPAHIQRWLTAAASLPPVVFEAAELRLYRSTLTADGPVYDTIAELPLSPGR